MTKSVHERERARLRVWLKVRKQVSEQVEKQAIRQLFRPIEEQTARRVAELLINNTWSSPT